MSYEWGPTSGGETLNFTTCPVCFCAVKSNDREDHEEYHERRHEFPSPERSESWRGVLAGWKR